MKAWKRFGAALVTLLALTAVLAGTALAAEPEGISVQLNGQPLAFTDAAPESADGRTFVPLRAVLEAMNAQVDYDSQTDTVNIHRGGVDLAMVLGQNTAAVTENGQTRTITMDVVPYVKNDRTYVPVRFVAEAFGCNVGWDNDARTVIIADIDAMLGDATFKLMDSFSAYCSKHEAGNMAMTGALAVDVADKTGGSAAKPVTVKGGLDGVTSDKGLQLSWNLKLDDPSKQLAAMLSQEVIDLLSDLKGEVRADLEAGMAYLTLPAALTGAAEGNWYSLDLSAYEAQLLGALDMQKLLQLEDAGIREVLTAVLRNMPLDDSQTSYAALAQVTDVYVSMLSDKSFTQKGSSYVAQMKLEDLVDVTVTLTKKGEDIVAADIKLDCQVDEDGEKMVMTMTEHAAPDKITVAMKLELDSSDMSFKLNLDVNGVPTTKAPVTAPPAGATIVPMG